MKVLANIIQEVTIDPIEVIEKLIAFEIGENAEVIEKSGKYYRQFTAGAGCHSFEMKEEITARKFNYVSALFEVLHHITKRKNDNRTIHR